MKLLVFLIIFCVLTILVNCTQNLYKLNPEHCEVTNINKSLIHLDIAKCYKLSRSELYLNISGYFKIDLLNDQTGQVLVTGYQFRSNEYRKGPVEFMLGMCTGLQSKDFDIPNMLANSNVQCPMLKGRNYYVYKLYPNATNMPPLIPAGRWMIQLDFMYMNQYVIGTVKWYSGIEYPIHLPEI